MNGKKGTRRGLQNRHFFTNKLQFKCSCNTWFIFMCAIQRMLLQTKSDLIQKTDRHSGKYTETHAYIWMNIHTYLHNSTCIYAVIWKGFKEILNYTEKMYQHLKFILHNPLCLILLIVYCISLFYIKVLIYL